MADHNPVDVIFYTLCCLGMAAGGISVEKVGKSDPATREQEG